MTSIKEAQKSEHCLCGSGSAGLLTLVARIPETILRMLRFNEAPDEGDGAVGGWVCCPYCSCCLYSA